MKPLLQTDSGWHLHLQHFTLRACQTLTGYRKCSRWYLNNIGFHFECVIRSLSLETSCRSVKKSRLDTSVLVYNISRQMYKTKWSPPLKCYIYLMPSIRNYPWHIYPDLHIQYNNSGSDSLMNINSGNPLAGRTVSNSLELMNTFFLPVTDEIHFRSCLSIKREKNNNWSQVVAIESGEKDQAHPSFDLVISWPGLPPTESLHLCCDPSQTPLLSITHRCLQVTSDFAQSSCNSLDILWDGNWMGSSHDSEWPEHESSWTEHIFVPGDTDEVIAFGNHKYVFSFWWVTTALKFYCDAIMSAILVSLFCFCLRVKCMTTMWSKWVDNVF